MHMPETSKKGMNAIKTSTSKPIKGYQSLSSVCKSVLVHPLCLTLVKNNTLLTNSIFQCPHLKSILLEPLHHVVNSICVLHKLLCLLSFNKLLNTTNSLDLIAKLLGKPHCLVADADVVVAITDANESIFLLKCLFSQAFFQKHYSKHI